MEAQCETVKTKSEEDKPQSQCIHQTQDLSSFFQLICLCEVILDK